MRARLHGPVLKRFPAGHGWQRTVARRTRVLWRRANVAMLHPGRCGSTVIGEMLGDHPRVHWDGELFEPRLAHPDAGSGGFARREIDRARFSTFAPVYGFETKYLPQQHLRAGCVNLDLAGYVDLLHELDFSKFIVLERRNYLRRAVSVAVGRARGEWHAASTPGAATRVHIDVDAFQTGDEKSTLLELFELMDESHAELLRLLRDDDVLALAYEDDVLGDPADGYRKACDFIGVEPRRPRVKLQRTNPFPYTSTIDNFDEVQAVLQGTRYAWMLDD